MEEKATVRVAGGIREVRAKLGECSEKMAALRDYLEEIGVPSADFSALNEAAVSVRDAYRHTNQLIKSVLGPGELN